MVVMKTMFEFGGELTRRGEIFVGGPVHVAHIVDMLDSDETSVCFIVIESIREGSPL